ncbi:TRAP transporter large permease [Tateyamaria sp. ANG-S1]|uniref:TRAP transporter large permease n=1 Tax=Tateyamaria sp. ANG-S1 TaxID=1577905 RepID=UPI00057DE126|nr:TRAP transporter large permease [Tateyamaria sp. ANG-S1]KIC48653.1 C4-dicarboxylate ABC transporter permease [Tateyamaria sp. ANG-S1]
MEWYWALSMLIGCLLVLMASGLPVAFAFFGVNILGAVVFMRGDPGVLQFLRSMVDGVQSFSLLPIPLFILMGEVMFHTGVAGRAIAAMDRLISRVPGRLSILAILGGTVFSSLSGSTIANTAMLGSTLLPAMLKRGYKPAIAIGPIVAVGGIAMLIPPSALAVLFGSVARIPIAELLLASIIPALILAALYFFYVILRCTIDPTLAPAYPVEEISLRDRWVPFFRDVVPLLGIFFVVVGSIITGLATPTESAALGVLATLIAAAAYRALSIEGLKRALVETLKYSTLTLFVVAGSLTFSQILSFSGATRGLSSLILSADLAPYIILLGMLGLTLLLGCFIDQVSMILLTVPLYLPLVSALGFDPVWFGVLMLLVLEISLATPPFGLLLFVMLGAAPKGTTLGQIVASVFPFLLMSVMVLLLLLAVPQIALWLPSLIQR